MTENAKHSNKALIFGYIIVAAVIGTIIWAAVGLISKPTETHTNSTLNAPHTASAKPEVASANTKLDTIISALKKQYPNVSDSYLFTPAKDPTGGLNKSGQYTNGAAFCDNYDTLYTPQDTTDTGGNANAYGFECGGTISVYPDATSASAELSSLQKVTIDAATGKCLLSSQGNTECSYKQVGHTIVHVSDVLTDSQQQEYLTFLSTEITSVAL